MKKTTSQKKPDHNAKRKVYEEDCNKNNNTFNNLIAHVIRNNTKYKFTKKNCTEN